MENSIQKPYKMYDRVQYKDCQFGEKVILGENSFLSYSRLGDGVQINRRNLIDTASIGDYSYTGANTIIKQTVIGKYCSISWNVSISGNVHEYICISSHPFPLLKSFGFSETDEQLETEPIRIGNDVWIGANVSVLPGVSVGDGAVIGAGAVVTKDVEPYTIVAGNPAKLIKCRFDDKQIQKLLSIKWWDWPVNEIKNNIQLFRAPLSNKTIDEMLRISRCLEADR